VHSISNSLLTWRPCAEISKPASPSRRKWQRVRPQHPQACPPKNSLHCSSNTPCLAHQAAIVTAVTATSDPVHIQHFGKSTYHGNTDGQHNHKNTGSRDGQPFPCHDHQQPQGGHDGNSSGQLVVGPNGMIGRQPTFGTRDLLPTYNANANTQSFDPGALRNVKLPTLCWRGGEEENIRRYCQSSVP
jgi:hypothetical protein